MPTTDPERVPLTSADPESAASAADAPGALLPLSRARALALSALALAAVSVVSVVSVAAVAREGSVHPARLGSAPLAWPMTRVLVHPDHGNSLDDVKEDWNQHHRGGADDLIPLYLPDLRAWPDAGGYRELTSLISGAGLREGTEFEYLKFDGDEKKTPTAIVNGFGEFASSALGHLAGWLEARERHARMLIMNDYATVPSNHMGPPEDFDAFVMSFATKGPKHWDVLFLDKGERGVRAEDIDKPFLTFHNAAWDAPYKVFRNHMDGEAGASFYAVSASFLRKLPDLLFSHHFTAVDGWLSTLCKDETLLCFSHMQEDWFYGLAADHLEGHTPPLPRTATKTKRGKPEAGKKTGKKTGKKAGKKTGKASAGRSKRRGSKRARRGSDFVVAS